MIDQIATKILNFILNFRSRRRAGGDASGTGKLLTVNVRYDGGFCSVGASGGRCSVGAPSGLGLSGMRSSGGGGIIHWKLLAWGMIAIWVRLPLAIAVIAAFRNGRPCVTNCFSVSAWRIASAPAAKSGEESRIFSRSPSLASNRSLSGVWLSSAG